MNDIQSDFSKIILSTEIIQNRVTELAYQINNDYKDVEQLLLVSILRGAFIFTADLTRQLSIPHIVDFMAITSYGKSTSTGEVRIIMDLREAIENQHVLIIEDIIDGGHTLHYLYNLLQDRKPASLQTCVMTGKKRERLNVPINYLGFEIPDVWAVGYGLDYADQYRTLPYIAELKKEIYTK